MENLRPGALLALARSDSGRKLIRYAMVSLVGVVVTEVIFVAMYKGFKVAAVPTNITAVAVSSVPAYILSKRWVWGKSGKSHMVKEVVPFWAFAFMGLVLSTLFVHWIQRYTDKVIWNILANMSGFGALWVARYFVLDKLIWGAHHHTPFDEDREAEAQARLTIAAMAEADLDG
jgi:putative flippase GtrA